MGGGYSLLFPPKFVANDAVPGQTSSVSKVASVLNICKKDLDTIYRAYVKLHTEGVTFKIVINYILMSVGVEATPWNNAIFKLWDEQIDYHFLNFEEFLEFIWSFLSLEDIMFEMLPFVMMDMDDKGYILGDDMLYLLFCLHGKQAERNKDLRLSFQAIRQLGDAPITRASYVNLVKSLPDILAPMYELRTGLTKYVGGLKFWLKYRDWRGNKVNERLQQGLMEISDYYVDDTCLLRFFNICDIEMPASTKARFNLMQQRHNEELALLSPDEKATVTTAKQKKMKQIRDASHEEDVMKIMAPIAHRLTFNVDNISGNKFARALAFGALRTQHKQPVAQLYEKHRGGPHTVHPAPQSTVMSPPVHNSKLQSGHGHHGNPLPGSKPEPQASGDADGKLSSVPGRNSPLPPLIHTGPSPSHQEDGHNNNHNQHHRHHEQHHEHHHEHHHHERLSPILQDQHHASHVNSDAMLDAQIAESLPIKSYLEETGVGQGEEDELQKKPAKFKPKPPSEAPPNRIGTNSTKGIMKRLTAVFSTKSKKGHVSTGSNPSEEKETDVLVAAQTQHNRFGNLRVKVTPVQDGDNGPGHVARIARPPPPVDQLDSDMQRRKQLMSTTGEFTDFQNEAKLHDSSNSNGRKSIIERISFAFHHVKTKSGQKQKKYKLKYQG